MALRLKGQTSGSVELDVPAAVSGGDVTLTLPNGTGSANQYLANGSTAGELTFVTPPGSFTSYAIISDQKTQNTNGGTFTSGAWRTRDLNNEITDVDNIVQISSDELQFTLGAGTYLIEASAPAHRVSSHMVKLYNATSSSDIAFGTTGFAHDADGHVHDTSIVKCRVTITGSTTFEIQHRGEDTRSTNGFGVAANFGPETYTVVEIYKEA